jgi:hypothetical protein
MSSTPPLSATAPPSARPYDPREKL